MQILHPSNAHKSNGFEFKTFFLLRRERNSAGRTNVSKQHGFKRLVIRVTRNQGITIMVDMMSLLYRVPIKIDNSKNFDHPQRLGISSVPVIG